MTRTVLVVDDERFIVELLAEVLSEEGFEVGAGPTTGFPRGKMFP